MQVENGISTKKSMMETAVGFENAEIKDIAFLNDRSLLLLRASEGKCHFTFFVSDLDLNLTIYRSTAYAFKHSLSSGRRRFGLSPVACT
jgi:hypothetical protein